MEMYGEGNDINLSTPSDRILRELEQVMERTKNTQKNDNLWISKETFDLVRVKSRALRKNKLEEVKQLGKEL